MRRVDETIGPYFCSRDCNNDVTHEQSRVGPATQITETVSITDTFAETLQQTVSATAQQSSRSVMLAFRLEREVSMDDEGEQMWIAWADWLIIAAKGQSPDRSTFPQRPHRNVASRFDSGLRRAGINRTLKRLSLEATKVFCRCGSSAQSRRS
jgi:hypothetical protein